MPQRVMELQAISMSSSTSLTPKKQVQSSPGDSDV